jgi:hypothetical protein
MPPGEYQQQHHQSSWSILSIHVLPSKKQKWPFVVCGVNFEMQNTKYKTDENQERDDATLIFQIRGFFF